VIGRAVPWCFLFDYQNNDHFMDSQSVNAFAHDQWVLSCPLTRRKRPHPLFQQVGVKPRRWLLGSAAPCLLSGAKRTRRLRGEMSPFDPKRTLFTSALLALSPIA